MIALHWLRVENFRSLRKVAVPLRELNVLVGANASGKSNLLEVIAFLGDVARLDLGPAIREHGGWDSLLFRGATRKPRIRIEIESQVTRYSSDQARDQYTIDFTADPTEGGILAFQGDQVLSRRESFQFKRTKGRGRRITVSGSKLEIDDERASKRKRKLATESAGLATLQKLGDDEGAIQVRELAEVFETFRVFDPNVEAARRPSPTPRASSLAHDASNLAAFLRFLYEDHAEVFDLLVGDLRALVPGLIGLHFEQIGGSTEGIRVSIEEHALSGRTELAQASFGTVRALALLAMLHDPSPPRLSCVEEIDHGLHPYALDRIVERLRSAAQKTQLILATHSPTLVNRLEPHELIICERNPETGASAIPAIDTERISDIAEDDELGLGELWFTGTLGGVP